MQVIEIYCPQCFCRWDQPAVIPKEGGFDKAPTSEWADKIEVINDDVYRIHSIPCQPPEGWKEETGCEHEVVWVIQKGE